MVPVVIYGVVATFVIYGSLTDLWTILFMGQGAGWKFAMGVYASALSFNIVHTVATVVFLLLLTKPMLEKLERVKVKYGMTVYGAGEES